MISACLAVQLSESKHNCADSFRMRRRSASTSDCTYGMVDKCWTTWHDLFSRVPLGPADTL
jgi:hypothetical protein